MGLTGEETDETDESKKFFALRAAPHTKPGVDAGNGAFWGFVLERNKQATGGSSRWGLGCILLLASVLLGFWFPPSSVHHKRAFGGAPLRLSSEAEGEAGVPVTPAGAGAPLGARWSVRARPPPRSEAAGAVWARA